MDPDQPAQNVQTQLYLKLLVNFLLIQQPFNLSQLWDKMDLCLA